MIRQIDWIARRKRYRGTYCQCPVRGVDAQNAYGGIVTH